MQNDENGLATDLPIELPCELIVLSGFLGSGKTTLLNRLLGDPSFSDTAVLINEFGEIGLDHLLVDSVEDEVIILDNGCVCCAIRDDLVAAIIGLIERASRGIIPGFSRIIIETTGLAKLDSLLRLICENQELARLVRLRGTLVTLDLISGADTLECHEEAIIQLMLADLTILTKGDLASPQQREATMGRAREWLENSQTIEITAIDELVDALHSIGREKSITPIARIKQASAAQSDHDLQCHCLRHDGTISRKQAEAWIGALCATHDSNIIRMKGLIHIAGEERPLFVQSVRQTIFPSQFIDQWPDASAQTQLVFFTKDLELEAIQNSFAQACLANWAEPAIWPNQPSFDAPYLGADRILEMIRGQLNADLAQIPDYPPWMLNGLHNPWGQAASHFPAWQILEFARDPAILHPVIDLIGPDLILFESALLHLGPAASAELHHAASFPVDPAIGASLIIPILGNMHLDGQDIRSPFALGSADFRPISTRDEQAIALILRYFPGNARYIRDAGHPAHIERRRRQLLLDSRSAPLWVAHGIDRADNDMITGFNPASSRWSVFPAIEPA